MTSGRLLLVGCGGIGFRHLEAAIASPVARIDVVEPNQGALLRRLNDAGLGGATGSRLQLHATLDEVEAIRPDIDWLISALTADVQLALSPRLFALGAAATLLEKPLGQSRAGVDEMVRHAGERSVFVNCSRNTWPGYRAVRAGIAAQHDHPVHVEVFGNLLGWGCNAVHFVELFRLFTDAAGIEPVSAQLVPAPQGNKRGERFEEFIGTAAFKNARGDTLQITSGFAEDKPFGIRMQVADRQRGPRFFISEDTAQLHELQTPQVRSLEPIFVSASTRLWIEGRLQGLPTLAEVAQSQRAVFALLERAFGREHFAIT